MYDAPIKKVSVKTQFKQFVESRAKQGRLKKVRTATQPEINPIDLTLDSPRPSLTRITPDSTMAISPIYNEIIPGTLKEKIDKYVELQRFINNMPNSLKHYSLDSTEGEKRRTDRGRNLIRQPIILLGTLYES